MNSNLQTLSPDLRYVGEKDRNIRSSSRYVIIVRCRYKDATFKTVTHWDATSYTSLQAQMNIMLTAFMIILLAAGTIIFTADARRLVILPIERMMKRVNEISDNPLSVGSGIKIDIAHEGMETTFLLQTIDKIGHLMRIGFGEAGAQIIAANLKSSTGDDQQGIPSLLTTGRGIVSIFGFCDIRNFTDTTECLQEEVMTFVNRVAHILHNVVKDCKGAANKNIGDAFLISWKVPQENCNVQTGEIIGDASDLFDNALYAFLRFTVLLRRHDDFVTAFSSEANKRLFQRMPEYRCAVGMGLHVGVAVEGAIGTEQKIDATYISLHVNNAEFLESSTKAYKVPLLMSHYFRDQLSADAQACCRHIDTVNVTDALHFQLWTYDVDYDADFSKKIDADAGKAQRRRSTFQEVLAADLKPNYGRDVKMLALLGEAVPDASEVAAMHSSVPTPDVVTFSKGGHGEGSYCTSLWQHDADLLLLRKKMSHDSFMDTWKNCIFLYSSGRWCESIAALTQFQAEFVKINHCRDGPADFLINFINSSAVSGQIVDDINHVDLHRLPH